MNKILTGATIFDTREETSARFSVLENQELVIETVEFEFRIKLKSLNLKYEKPINVKVRDLQ